MKYILPVLILLISSEATPQPRTFKLVVQTLNPNLSLKETANIQKAILDAANTYGVDKHLIAAIIATESTFKPNSRGSIGEIGLMQLRPEYHLLDTPAKDRERQLYRIDVNVREGTKFLSQIKRRYKAKYAKFKWIELYNRGFAKKPVEFAYWKRVMNNYTKIAGVEWR